MSEAPAIQRISTPAKMALLRFGLSCVVMAGGILALWSLARAMNWHFEKPPTPLRRDLSSMPRALGTPWAYEADGLDKNLKPDEVQTLGTEMYLLRDYVDIAKRDKPAHPGVEDVGTKFTLNLNYYATGSGTVHVPDICWTASGLIRNRNLERDFTVSGVKLADGSVITLPVRMLVFEPTTEQLRRYPAWKGHEEEHQMCVAYTFNVNGNYVNDRNEVMQQFWRADLPFAYHAKIEVKVEEPCRPEQAQAAIEPFFRAAMVEVSKCLPDANELKAAAQNPSGAAGTQPNTMKDSATRP